VKKKRSYLAWYIASPFFVFGLVRLALVLPSFMDTKRGFTPVYHTSNVSPEEHLADPLAARDAASSALRDLAHDAAADGEVTVAKRAYDVDAALQRRDARAARDSMRELQSAAGDANRLASQLALAKVRVDAWLALVATD
jgi:hypothetical protein